MLNALARLFGPRRLPTYEARRDALEAGTAALRARIAADPAAEPEMLYYLSGDADAGVRRQVAANPATPRQANEALSSDADGEVRAALARKIARLVPGLDPVAQERLYAESVALLEKLAADHLPAVRAIVAEEIAHAVNVPRALVRQLASDIQAVVAAPVIEWSPLLSDADLVEIVAAAKATEVLQAVARRRPVAEPVADAVAASLDIPAIAQLLANADARVREETLDRLAEAAEEIPAWHGPLVMRADLSVRALRRIAGFVAASLLDQLEGRIGLDHETRDIVAKRVRARLAEAPVAPGEDEDRARLKAAVAAVEAAGRAGTLDDEAVTDWADNGRREHVLASLALKARVPYATAQAIADARSGKAMVALAWKAGFSMRTALRIQTAVLKLPRHEQVLPRGGFDFPLTDDEMRWHLDYFGAA